MSVARRRQMVEREHASLSVAAQCRLVSISRSSFSYAPVPEKAETLALMAVIDASFLDHPWYGSRQMARHLGRLGHPVGRRRVRRLMAKMGLVPICSAPSKLDRLKLEFSATFSWLGEELGTMKASKFTQAQTAFVLKQGEEGTAVAEVCRKAGISQATYFNWKKRTGGLLPDEMRRLRALEDENARLKKIVADLTLDREMLQDVIRRKL